MPCRSKCFKFARFANGDMSATCWLLLSVRLSNFVRFANGDRSATLIHQAQFLEIRQPGQRRQVGDLTPLQGKDPKSCRLASGSSLHYVGVRVDAHNTRSHLCQLASQPIPARSLSIAIITFSSSYS